jgi:alpha-1,6-mannosyltransferase
MPVRRPCGARARRTAIPRHYAVKICDLTQFYSPVSGGVRRYIEQKIAFLRKHRPDCRHILIVPGEVTGRTGDDHATVYTIASPLVSRTSRYRVLLKLHLVEEALERERPDIMESGDPYQLAWKVAASSSALGIPAVGFYHSHFPEAHIRTVAKYFGRIAVTMAEDTCRRYVKTLYNHFERTLVPSPVLGKLLGSWGVENAEPLDLGVDIDIFHPERSPDECQRKKLGIPSEARVLLYVGRLALEKNVLTLFDAFQILAKRNAWDYHLICVGDGNQRPSLLKLKEETGRVHWQPYCGNSAELAAIYRSADLFVHPGVQETFGLVALESQACGTPVVGIRGSYMDRIIFSDQMLWADHNSPEALADAIDGKFQHDLRAAGLSASDRVRRQYSWQNTFERLFSIYGDVIGKYRK